jgi:hypothetical protein
MNEQLDDLLLAIARIKPETLSDEDLERMEHILNIGANVEYLERRRRIELSEQNNDTGKTA